MDYFWERWEFPFVFLEQINLLCTQTAFPVASRTSAAAAGDFTFAAALQKLSEGSKLFETREALNEK